MRRNLFEVKDIEIEWWQENDWIVNKSNVNNNLCIWLIDYRNTNEVIVNINRFAFSKAKERRIN